MDGGRLEEVVELSANRVLVVEDDASLADLLGIVLQTDGFEPVFEPDGQAALDTFRETRPDLVLLDLSLPGRDGLEVCRDLRRESGVPIIMLTGRGDTEDIVRGLECGADDYVIKPFKPAELVARVRARLRGGRDADTAETLTVDDVVIDVAAHEVIREGTPVTLTPIEFDLLVALARQPRQVFSREMLLQQVWGYRHVADTRLVNVHVQRLRAKVEKDPEQPRVVLTVRGVGYRAGPV
jgi:two-component system response regulator MtrA